MELPMPDTFPKSPDRLGRFFLELSSGMTWTDRFRPDEENAAKCKTFHALEIIPTNLSFGFRENTTRQDSYESDVISHEILQTL
jgi:hypothetical protein